MSEPVATAAEHTDAKPEGVHIALVPPCRLLVKATAGARVVGKSGVSIKAIRAESGATVRVFQDELPEIFKRRDENIVLASCGEVSSLKVAVLSILDRIFDRSGLPDAAERNRERPFVVDVLVPERAAGPLVGPGGERIKALIEELSCDIDVVREPLAGIAAQRRVRVLSRERARVEATVWRLQELLAELVDAGTLKPEHFELREEVVTEVESERLQRNETAGDVVPLRILLAPGEAAVVVGKLGYSIRRLRDIAHVSVDSTDAPPYNAESPPFEINESVCLVGRASLANRLRVLRLIMADLVTSRASRRQEPLPEDGLPEGARPCSIRLLFPSNRWEKLAGLLPLVVGQFACSLRIETGVTVRVLECAPAACFRRLELQGTEDQIASAAWRLHQTFEPWEAYEVPPRYDAVMKANDEQDEGKGSGKGGKLRPSSGPKGNTPEVRSETRLLSTAFGANRAATHMSASEPARQEDQARQVSAVEKAASLVEGRIAPTTSDPYLPPSLSRQAHGEDAHHNDLPHIGHIAAQTNLASDSGTLSQNFNCPMYIAVENDSIAHSLADSGSSIAKLAGVKVNAWPGNFADARPPAVEISGPPECCAMASYLIQVHQWLYALKKPA